MARALLAAFPAATKANRNIALFRKPFIKPLLFQSRITVSQYRSLNGHTMLGVDASRLAREETELPELATVDKLAKEMFAS